MKVFKWIVIGIFILSIGGIYDTIIEDGVSSISYVLFISAFISGIILYISAASDSNKDTKTSKSFSKQECKGLLESCSVVSKKGKYSFTVYDTYTKRLNGENITIVRFLALTNKRASDAIREFKEGKYYPLDLMLIAARTAKQYVPRKGERIDAQIEEYTNNYGDKDFMITELFKRHR